MNFLMKIFRKFFPKKNKLLDYKINIDYTYISNNGIKLLTTKFKGVIYSISSATVKEDGGGAILNFNYEIEDSRNFTQEQLEGEEFRKVVGDILLSIILNAEELNESECEFEPDYIEMP